MDHDQQAAKDVAPTALANLPLVCMADQTQVQMFSELGRLRSPFQGIAEWPWIDEALAEASARLLEKEGRRAWEARTGGVNTPDGQPYCTMSSELAAQVVEDIASGPGGLLWLDDHGFGWAVKLGQQARWDRMVRYGFAITWGGNAILLDQKARNRYDHHLDQGLQELHADGRDRNRAGLETAARRLRLFNRAEQLLWMIHFAILTQRSSTVLLPDVMLAEVVWGGDRACWPQDWRGDLMQTLRSLTQLHTEVLRLSGIGWMPRLGAHSVGVTHVEQLTLTRPDEDFCRPCCPLHHATQRHTHFLVQVGCGFLGVLEKFMAGNDGNGTRTYDFKTQPAGETGKELRAYQRQGGTPSVNLIVNVLGPSRWSGLSSEQQQIMQAMNREVTRGRGSSRPDKAFVLRGNQVPNTTGRNQTLCPYLDADGTYVAFNGNGRRRGLGYRIVGESGRGWLNKCGYAVPLDDSDGVATVVRGFLRELATMADLLGLTVAAIHPQTGQWYDLEYLTHTARGRRGWEELDPLHLRIYAAEDYLDRCRGYFERRGSLWGLAQAASGSLRAVQIMAVASTQLSLSVRMQRVGISQGELAGHVGRSRSFVSRLLNGRKPWPVGLREQADAYVSGRERNAATQGAEAPARAQHSV
jgi:hypothetical protein